MAVLEVGADPRIESQTSLGKGLPPHRCGRQAQLEESREALDVDQLIAALVPEPQRMPVRTARVVLVVVRLMTREHHGTRMLQGEGGEPFDVVLREEVVRVDE